MWCNKDQRFYSLKCFMACDVYYSVLYTGRAGLGTTCRRRHLKWAPKMSEMQFDVTKFSLALQWSDLPLWKILGAFKTPDIWTEAHFECLPLAIYCMATPLVDYACACVMIFLSVLRWNSAIALLVTLAFNPLITTVIKLCKSTQLWLLVQHRTAVSDPEGDAADAPPPHFDRLLLFQFCIRMLKNKAQIARKSIKSFKTQKFQGLKGAYWVKLLPEKNSGYSKH